MIGRKQLNENQRRGVVSERREEDGAYHQSVCTRMGHYALQIYWCGMDVRDGQTVMR